MVTAKRENAPASGLPRVAVSDGDHQRPFMRGILVHSLMARDLPFDDSLRVADLVRDRIANVGVIARPELAVIVKQVLQDEFPEVALKEPTAPIEIIVGEGRDAEPFSKGHLSQSLLASGLDPSDAFDSAREIESRLRVQRVGIIERSALRRMSFDVLSARFGPRTADRYLCWRHYQEPERPVVVLIGGTAGTGKTSVALEVALRLGISRVLSTDSIREVMRSLIPRELVPALHVSSFDAHRELSVGSENENPAVDGFIAHASAVSLGVRAMIDRAVEENASLILDGVPLAPGMIDLESYGEVADVIHVLLARLDEDAFRSHFVSRAKHERRRDSARYLGNLDAIFGIQEYLLELADTHDVPIVDNVSVDRSVERVIKHIVDVLRKKRELNLLALIE